MEYKLSFGSISHGTLRSEDLLDAFLSEAEARFPDSKTAADTRRVRDAVLEVDDAATIEAFYASDWVSSVINEDLHDLLNEDLLPFMYFGANEGDGADFGYWFDYDAFETSVQDGETIKVEELPEDLADFYCMYPDAQYIAVISDHGNIELYTAGGEHIYGIV
jgi:hypothetical protein